MSLLDVREHGKVNSNLISYSFCTHSTKNSPRKLRNLHATVLNSSYKTLNKDIVSCRQPSLRTITVKQNNSFVAKTFSCDIITLDVSIITAIISQILHQNTQRKEHNNDERGLAIINNFVSVCVWAG